MSSKHQQVVLVTGASKPKGIGLAIAVHLSQKGYKVYATYRRTSMGPKLKEWAAKHGFPIKFIYLDLADEDSIQEAVQEVIKTEGRIDVLINNAAYGVIGAIETQNLKQINHQMQVNFIGPMLLCQEVLPSMRAHKHGVIINVSSVQGVIGFPYAGFCSASKAALEAATEALAIEAAPWNVRAVIAQPGHVSTRQSIDKGARLDEDKSPYKKAHDAMWKQLEIKEKTPKIIPHIQTPQEIAEFIEMIIKDKKGKVRYQSSKASEQMAGIKLKDVDGTLLWKEMHRMLESIGC